METGYSIRKTKSLSWFGSFVVNHLFNEITDELIVKLEQKMPTEDADRDQYITSVQDLLLKRERAMTDLKAIDDEEKNQLMKQDNYINKMLSEQLNLIKNDLKSFSNKKNGRNKYLNSMTLTTQNGVYLDRQSK